MKKSLPILAAALLSLTGIRPVQGMPLPAGDTPVPILAYHNIGPQALSKWYVSAEQFAQQMDVLQAYGYQTVGLQDYLDYRSGAVEPPAKPIIITFDDGYQGVYTYAMPILLERGMTASIFIPTGMIGEDEDSRQDNGWLPSEPRSSHLIWPEVTALASEFEIGSHTVTHRALGNWGESTARAQLEQSRQAIQSHLGETQGDFLAYPNGSDTNAGFDLHSLVQDTEYKVALDFGDPEEVAIPATSDLWALPRRAIYWDISLDLNPQNPWPFFMRRVDPDFPLPNIIATQWDSLNDPDPWQVLDADGNPRVQFYPGETVTITARVKSGNAPVDVTASLLLQQGETTIYDSHLAQPVGDVALQPLPSGWTLSNFTYQWTIPPDTASGGCSGTLSIRDASYLLGFYRSAPEALFEVVRHNSFLPFVGR
jgi:peptidoglycan/xylan/chitin deacetylase (PgdA/CDA1 family)